MVRGRFLLAAALLLAWPAHAVEFGVAFVLTNCTNDTVDFAAFDSTDSLLGIPASAGRAAPGGTVPVGCYTSTCIVQFWMLGKGVGRNVNTPFGGGPVLSRRRNGIHARQLLDQMLRPAGAAGDALRTPRWRPAPFPASRPSSPPERS